MNILGNSYQSWQKKEKTYLSSRSSPVPSWWGNKLRGGQKLTGFYTGVHSGAGTRPGVLTLLGLFSVGPLPYPFFHKN